VAVGVEVFRQDALSVMQVLVSTNRTCAQPARGAPLVCVAG
jgi:hypothetical protein